MSTEPRPNYSFSLGLRVVGRGIVMLAKTKPLIFIWINVFATWFVGGGALMLYRGSTSILPIVCIVTGHRLYMAPLCSLQVRFQPTPGHAAGYSVVGGNGHRCDGAC